ncbi:MAG: AarF/UbiB family protein [Desulfobacterales bacterium]|nr:AarF/UbiB family protein [Desulfobacterales bacterium]
MGADIPTGRLSRTLSSGRVAARMGGNQVRYLMKRPFLSEEGQQRSREKRDADNAKILFKGLSLLRGTALKAAQMLSFERELIPESFQKELEKSYFQVPPINRALIRKIIVNGLGAPPERLFDRFDSTAFAAASLGQVHRARSKDGRNLAVKVQYPDMNKTIANDLRMLRTLVRPMADYDLIKLALEEIREVLLAETDYEAEAGNIRFFRDNLDMDNVKVPRTEPALSTGRILTMSFMEGRVLSQWLETGPDQESRNRVAQTLNDIFIRGFYELNLIHADPNPGNFLIRDNLDIGLLDFGCVRAVTPEFVSLYRELIRIGGSNDRDAYWSLLVRMKFMPENPSAGIRDEVVSLFMKMGAWINRVFREEYFDFGANPDFMARGRELGRNMQKIRRHMEGFPPEFVFLDRTRYGLIRLYEQMGVRIKLRNRYEYNDSV